MSTSVDCRSCTGAAHDLFSCLLDEQRAKLSKAAVPHAYGPHESIFHSGTPSLALYCVRSGSVKLFRRVNNGDEFVVGIRGPGDLLGLRGVLAGTPYAATAMTLEPAVICAIPGESFLSLLRENPLMGFRLLQRLAHNFRLLEDQLVERTYDRVGKRTARFLIQQIQKPEEGTSEPGTIAISASREEMAQLIGTTPETLSRTLHGFASDGILEVDRREIRVLDLTALLRLAE